MIRRRCIVVGGGVIGALSALHLSDSGCEVLLIEKNELFSGASSAALGALTPHSDHEASHDTQLLAEASLNLFPEFIARIKTNTNITIPVLHTGTLELAFDELHLNSLKLLNKNNKIKFLNAADTLKLQPSISPQILGALHFEQEKTIDTELFLTGIAQLLKLSTCKVLTNTVVLNIVEKNNKAMVQTALNEFEADDVIVCPGCGYRSIGGLPNIPITSIMGEVIQVKAKPGMVTSCLYSGDGFIAPREDGHLLLGSNYEPMIVDAAERVDSIRVSSAIKIMSANCRIVPQLSDCQITRLWKSWRPKTPDGQPILGRLNQSPIVLAAGFYGLGITLSLVVAEKICKIILKKKYDIDTSPFAPARYL